MGDPFISQYMRDLLANVRTQVGVPPAFPLPLPVLLIAGRVFRGVLLGGQMCEGQGERHLERRAGQGWSVGPAGAPAGSGSATCNPLLPHA